MFEKQWREVKIFGRRSPVRVIPLGYALYTLLGAAALLLPWCRTAPASAGMLDHLFISASAVSTTGLCTVSIRETYSFWGQLVILLLIQVGGVGFMTMGSFITLAVSGRISPFRRGVATAVLSMPKAFDLKRFLWSIVSFTLLIELAGAIALYPAFAANGLPMAWWQAIFHSVSAFCTAGFGLLDNSFENFRGNLWVNGVLMALSYLGAVGFIVMSDWWEWLTGQKKGMTLTSKIILWCTATISLAGTALFALNEPSVAGLPWLERITASWFQVMTASTTVGFNTMPIGALSGGSLFLLAVVMIIGASPSGTGGGIKTTSVTALWAVIMAVFRREEEVKFAGRVIPAARVRAATANVMFYLLTLSAGIYFVALAENHPLTALMFECASALGTVGLSCGITGALSTAGKLLIIGLMFLGRVGPLALGVALFITRRGNAEAAVKEDVVI